MTSPITHEKIIEVLREIVEANDQYRSGLIDGWIDPMNDACDRARDLYQRLQAEKEGGWQPTHWIAAAGAKFERVTQAWCPDIPGEMVVFRNRDGRHFVRPLDTFNSLYTPLNQEGGDAAAPGPASADRPHVAPPASANAGTGRAIAEEDYDPSDVGPPAKYSPRWYAELIVDNAECGAQLEIKDEVLRESLVINAEKQIANAVQRGKAEGERIEREVVASWMIAQGFATGHGDTTSDLLSELADGIADRVSRSERIGIEKAATIVSQARFGEHDSDLRSILASIRALTGDPQT